MRYLVWGIIPVGCDLTVLWLLLFLCFFITEMIFYYQLDIWILLENLHWERTLKNIYIFVALGVFSYHNTGILNMVRKNMISPLCPCAIFKILYVPSDIFSVWRRLIKVIFVRIINSILVDIWKGKLSALRKDKKQLASKKCMRKTRGNHM